jgi:hypothetical protein
MNNQPGSITRRHAPSRAVIRAGLLAGVMFLSSKLMMAATLGSSALAPLQLIGVMALGERAQRRGVATISAALAIHLLLSLVYGTGFFGVMRRVE